MSIELVWPPGMHPEVIALSFVLIMLSVGVLLHACHGWAARVPLAFLALALAVLQSMLAYHRTMELTRPSTPPVLSAPADEGLVIAGVTDATVAPAVAAPAPSVPIEGNRLMSMMAALLAFTLSLGGLTVGWGAYSLASPGLVWIGASPVLLLLLLFSGALLLGAIAAEAVHAAVAGAAELWTDWRHRLILAVQRLLPADWSAEADCWRRARFERRARSASRQAESEAQASQVQQARYAAINWDEREREFADSERQRDLDGIAAAHQVSRGLIHGANIQAVKDQLEVLHERRKTFVADACDETFAELKKQIPKTPAEYVQLLFLPLSRLRRLTNEIEGGLLPMPPVEPVYTQHKEN